MGKRGLLLLSVILLVSSVSFPALVSGNEAVTYQSLWESVARHDASPQWYRDAVLGIYFHWGVYSVAGMGEWYAQRMYAPREDPYHSGDANYHRKTYGDPCTEFGYHDFVPLFKAEKWDPDFWADLFKHAGADFAGPVAEHHDGFAMWASDIDEYNAGDMGPCRDITGDMARAVRARGMKFLTAFHNLRWNWRDVGRKLCPEGVGINDPKYSGLYGPVHKPGAPMTDAFRQEWLDKMIEVIDKYQPDEIYLEGNICKPAGDKYVLPFLIHYFDSARQWGREVVVTHKKDDLPLSCSPLDMEGSSLKEPSRERWQTDHTILNKWYWGYDIHAKCLPVNGLIDGIVDRTSKNGVTLLSIGPKADGTIPDDQINVLLEIGDWMQINKEALYAAHPAPFSKGGVDVWRAGSLRFTEKEGHLYAIDLEQPKPGLVIPGLTLAPDCRIRMLGSPQAIAWYQAGTDVVIDTIPEPLPCDYAWTFKIPITPAGQ